MAQKLALGQRSKSDFAKKLVGVVEVTVGETKAKFELVDEGKKFANGKNTLIVPLDELPPFPKLTQAHSGKQFRIRMNNDGDEVEALTPVSGHYTAKLIDLGPRKEKDDDPTPFERVFDEGGPKEERHLEFFAVYKIVSGAFKGVQMPGYYLHYKFEKDEDGKVRFAGNFENKKATRLFQLRDWGVLHGMFNEEIEWDDVTILPELLERGLENDVLVDIIVKDGYIKEVLPAQDDEPFQEPKVLPVEEAEEPKAKRSVKEIKEEMGVETDNVDADFPKKATKKQAKKVVEEDDEEL